jgi:hypothetical protein
MLRLVVICMVGAIVGALIFPVDQYDALATPIPPHLASLVKQLKTQERG